MNHGECHTGNAIKAFIPWFFGRRHSGIGIWDIESGDKLTTFDGPTVPTDSLVFSPDGKTLVSIGRDGTILVWDWDEVLKGLDR